MIKRHVKCPRCGKPLLHVYSPAITGVVCTCGFYINLKKRKGDKDKCQQQN